MRAAAQAGVVLLPKPLVNLVIDQATLEATLARLTDDQPPPAEPDREACRQRRCETVDGVVVDPRQVIIAMIRGHSRRIITDTATGRAIDIGRKRFFRGAVRDAVLLNTPRCVHPGCLTPGSCCQIDHIRPSTRGGETNTDNGAPRCPSDHRSRHRLNLRDIRGPDGQWHTHRPDGTEIAPTQRGQPPPPEPKPEPEQPP